jgi:hypothetical protein
MSPTGHEPSLAIRFCLPETRHSGAHEVRGAGEEAYAADFCDTYAFDSTNLQFIAKLTLYAISPD